MLSIALVVVVLMVVVLQAWRRGQLPKSRLGDREFDRISEGIAGFWGYCKHAYLCCFDSCTHREACLAHEFDD